MSKCTRCQKDFIPLLKSDGLPYKTCDRCKCTDKKYRDKHKEQIKLYRDQYYLDNQDKIKEYREVNKDKIREQRKEYREVNKDKISTKNKLDRITCECGCTSRKDKLSQHKKSSCHQKLMEEKNKLKRNLTDEELDVFFRTNYTFQNYPKGILITSYSQTI
jgi:hypothetical protein